MIVLACLTAMLSACTGDSATRPAVSQDNNSRRIGFLATPEWERDITPSVLSSAMPISLGAGYGVVGLIQRRICQRTIFLLRDSARSKTWGRCYETGDDDTSLPQIGLATDIVYVAPEGVPWHLNPAARMVVTENISGRRIIIARLRGKGAVQSACSSDGHQIVFTDPVQPGVLIFQDISNPDSIRLLTVPDSTGSQMKMLWDQSRFGGSTDGPCVLSSRYADRVLAIYGDTLFQLIKLKKPVQPEKPTRWYTKLLPTGNAEPRLRLLDVASYQSGVAVLYADGGPMTGRLVDIYRLTGEYWQTMILPSPAKLISSAYGRLYVLTNRENKWYLASYHLPVTSPVGIDRDSIVEAPVPDTFRVSM